MTEKYNGWTNYETWNVKLWIDNDEGSYRHWQAAAQGTYDDALADPPFTREERATLTLAESIKEEFEQAAADILERSNASASWAADLLGAALSEVNWYEIAEHMIEDVDKTETAEST